MKYSSSHKTGPSRSLTQDNPSPPLWLAGIICSLATTFLLYAFILQVSPSVMTRELMHDLGLTTTGLGALSAFYYYAYTPMQLPAGILLDRFGARRLLTFATLMCAIGAIAFGIASHPATAAMGRFLMGISSSFAFIGALVLIANWFPPNYFALLSGLVQLASSVGAIAGQAPLAMIIKQWGWRSTLCNLGVAGLVLTGLIWLIVRDKPSDLITKESKMTSFSFAQERARLMQVLKNRQTWWIGLYSFMVWAPVIAFAGLWGIPFLMQAYELTLHDASSACAMIWLAVGIGSPLLGGWSDKIQRRRLPLTLAALTGAVSLSLIIYYPLSSFWFYFNLFLTGLGATGQTLAFGVVKDNNAPEITGTAIGFNNMAVVAGGALFQPLIGLLLAWSWDGTLHAATQEPLYHLTVYQKAFFLMPVYFLIAALISHFALRETYCQSQVK